MKEENLEQLFKNLQGTFDTEEPTENHKKRFLGKLNASKNKLTVSTKKNIWWRPLSIAASIAILIAVGIQVSNTNNSTKEQIAEISLEISQTQFYFANLIEEEVKKLEQESGLETKEIIADAMVQLKKLEVDYEMMEQDLINGGNSKLILSAMITNFQIRIDLLQNVLSQVETIKTLKNNTDEEHTI